MMQHSPKRTTVVGVFSNRDDAERGIDNLIVAGFREDQIGILYRGDQNAAKDSSTKDKGSKAGQGAATGAVVGGLAGAAASLLIPGVGPVIAGGILATVLGTAAVGAAAGGIIGGLVGLGIPEDEARYYEGEIKSGRTLVTVKADGRWDEARSLLRQAGAYDVHDQPGSGSMRSGLTDTAHPGTMGTDTARTRNRGTLDDTAPAPLTEEERIARRNRE